MPAVYSKICTADKTRIFQAYTRVEDYIQLARQIGIKRTTAYQIVCRALEHDGTVAFPRGGLRSVKRSQEMLETVIAIDAFALWKQALKTRLAEVRHDLLDQPFNERMATLAQLAEQETAVVTPNAMAAAFRGPDPCVYSGISATATLQIPGWQNANLVSPKLHAWRILLYQREQRSRISEMSQEAHTYWSSEHWPRLNTGRLDAQLATEGSTGQ
ncbi:hypothetical protein PoB_006519700 [Plakobranchus ocellatus]|uniref:Uncharacterized protein n=1 Tax=Plakobranchus ocellatus TaxID=259542 RepID=A0AAV4D3E6_9GAST|nr:hypothetical protein PoB_006519700 [Plakobranchus ocellatus]